MTRIDIEAPGLKDRQQLDLGPGESALVGREPERAPSDEHGRAVVIASPSVSGQHLLVRCEDELVRLRDLGSRNGSWLRLPPNREVSIAHGDAIQIQLARAPHREGDADDPEDANWQAPADFGAAVVQRACAWLLQQGVQATVQLHRGQPRPGEDDPGRLPLAGGAALLVRPSGTVDSSWSRRLQQLWRYVDRQNAIFRAEELARGEGLILASPAIRRAHRQVIDAAARGLRVLLIGPSGSGKEGLARVYHRNSGRKGPFVALNCALFSRELLRAELFGVEGRAFTNVEQASGAVERAHRGTLFLDEIGEMTGEVQPMLLRFLDHGQFERLGSYGRPQTVEVAIVCATNRDLKRATKEGTFREDLWYRISTIIVDVPPLRERPEDMVAFLETYRIAPSLSAWAALDEEARALLLAHRWDGNFRSLTNFAQRLPRSTREGALAVAACREALEAGELEPIAPPPRPGRAAAGAGIDWAALASEAASAFAADHQGPPQSWRDIQGCLEKYLKPLLFAHASGGVEMATLAEALANASKLGADRGTAGNQLRRFFARFRRAP
jgi:DNA-binding NtrC family response regulator